MSKCGVFSGPYFPVFELNTGKCGLEKTQCLDTIYAMLTNLYFPTNLTNLAPKSHCRTIKFSF